jgi:hypothetical protein
MTHITIEKAKLEQVLEALKIARDQIVDPEYAPIGWSVSRLDEVLSTGKQALAAQPAVPDAITDDSESPEYRTGWNDCRQAMLKARDA